MGSPNVVRCSLLLGLFAGAQSYGAPEPAAAGAEAGKATYVAPYLSEQAQAVLRRYSSPTRAWPNLDDTAGWTAHQQAGVQVAAATLQRYGESGKKFERRAADIPGIDAYWFMSSEVRADAPVLVYTHGGGYVGGSGREISPAVLAIAEAAGRRLLSIDYRLAPQHPFPAAVDDAITAYRWLLAQRIAPGNIGWFGESAGGGLALASLHAMKLQGLPVPGGIAVLSPWTDLTLSSESYVTLDADDPVFTYADIATLAKAYHQQTSPQNALVSPVLGDFSGFPPMLIQVGGKEILLSDSLRVARAARAAKVEVELDVWDGMWHVFPLMDVPESREAIRELGVFFRRTASQQR